MSSPVVFSLTEAQARALVQVERETGGALSRLFPRKVARLKIAASLERRGFLRLAGDRHVLTPLGRAAAQVARVVLADREADRARASARGALLSASAAYADQPANRA